MADLPLEIVVAVARNGVIGREGGLPWHIPADLKFFKAQTLGKPVIMGRRTWASIGRPLPGRTNIVVTRDPAFAAEGAEVFATLEGALAHAQGIAGATAVSVIGGGDIYRQTIDRAATLILTEVDAAPDGDTRFPEIDPRQWRETWREAHLARDGQPGYTFKRLERVTRPVAG